MRALTFLLLATFLAMLMSPVQAATDPAPARDGVWPLVPRPAVTSRFDPPASRWGAGHRGVDLQGRAGQGVRTALAGRVTFAARLAGRGVVVVDHGGVRTTYEPVSASVHAGQHVARGARIGALQRASSHCFPAACLHWGLLRGESYLDPLTLVGGGPIRLLPLAGTMPAWIVP
jgi:murein DD-endopeptidase MepM/ murein hydrolase activator NlpD